MNAETMAMFMSTGKADAKTIMAMLKVRAELEGAMDEAKRLHDDALASGADAVSVAYDAGRYAGIRDALEIALQALGA